MGISLAPDPAKDVVETDPLKKPPVAAAPKAPTAPAALPAMTAPAPLPVTPPAPTVAAPAAPVNRIGLATQAFDTLQKAREPGDRRALEAVTSQAAGMGQLGSGQWRTALANKDNERQLQLDTARDELINKATEGSIADASTAYQQALAGSQLGLAAELGRANVDIGKGQLDLAKTGQAGSLALEKERLDQSSEQFGQSLAFQKEQAAIDAAYKNGTLTLAQRDQKLRELQNAQSNERANAQLELAKGESLGRIQTGVDEAGNPIYQDTAAAAQAKAQLALQTKAQEFDEKVRTGQMTLAEKDQALRELAQQQQGEQFRLSLAENARQFGASQEQQMALAKLADATQNRQIDVSTAQGKNALLLELARIMGGPNGNVDPAFIQAIARALGMDIAAPTRTGGTTTGNVGTGTGTTGGQSTGGYGREE